MSTTDKMQERLYGLLIKELINRIEGGEVSAPELNCARQLLKDMGYTPTVPEDDSELRALNERMKEAMKLDTDEDGLPIIN